MDNLTSKQRTFFEKLKELYANEPLPSFEIIAEEFNFKHKNSIWQYFTKLKQANLILEKNKRFYINPDFFGAPMFTTSIRAGFASVLEDGIEKRVSLDDVYEINNPSTFLFKVSGDSMVDLGIFHDDTVIIKKCETALNGQIVLACVDGDFTLKTYRKKDGEVFLEPANSSYEIIRPKSSLTIFGVAVGITRKL